LLNQSIRLKTVADVFFKKLFDLFLKFYLKTPPPVTALLLTLT